MHIAVLGKSVASTPEEKAAVDAWMQFWQGAANALYSYRTGDKFLVVADGSAKTSVQDLVESLKAKHQRIVGWARDNVISLKVRGDQAAIHDCANNFTFTVDREIEPLTKPLPYLDVTGTLEKKHGHWVVVKQKTRQLDESCLS